MLSFNSLAPGNSRDDVQSFLNLLAVVADPKAAKAALLKIANALLEANAVIEAAKVAQQSIDAAKAEHDAALKKERDEHDRSLADAKAKSDRACSLAMDEVRRQRADAGELRARASKDAKAASEIRADLEQRLAKIKAAAA